MPPLVKTILFCYCLCRNNRILERHLDKMGEVIEASLTVLENEECAIHRSALPCITNFPWKVHYLCDNHERIEQITHKVN